MSNKPNIQVNTKDANGYTSLHEAVLLEDLQKVQELLQDKGTDVNVKDTTIHQLTPLDVAVSKGNYKIVAALLHHKEINVDTKDTSGYTPLHRAGRAGNLDIITALLAHRKIKVNAKSTKYGYTPLHKAVMDDNEEMVQALLSHQDIDVFVKDKDGDTALHLLYTHKVTKFNDTIYIKFEDYILKKAENEDISELTDLILKVEPPRKLKSTGFVEKRDKTISTLQDKINKKRQEKQVGQKFLFDHKIYPYDLFVSSSSVAIAHLIKKMEKSESKTYIKETFKNAIILNNSSLHLVRKIQKVNDILENDKVAYKIAGFVMKQPALQEKELKEVLTKMKTYISSTEPTMQDSKPIITPLVLHKIPHISGPSTQPPIYSEIIKAKSRGNKEKSRKVNFQLP